MKKTTAIVSLLFVIFVLSAYAPFNPLGASKKGVESASTCISGECHAGIETTSENHDFACVECHQGNNKSLDKDEAHKGMLGGRNPSSSKTWDEGCGKCHQYQHDRVSTTLMYTATGMIKNSQKAWNDYEGKLYSTHGAEGFDASGNETARPAVTELEELSGELYRKFCSACHLGYDKRSGYRAHHSSGCAGCHFNHSVAGTYEGGDKTIKGKEGYPEKHIIDPLPKDDVCITCHNRSGRIALSYQGLYDGNNSLVPTMRGLPGPELIDGVRNLRHMHADIHSDAGMECIDCHTSRDIMGDGYMYENMFDQIETACEDCHGGETAPKTERITKENAYPLREAKNYAFDVNYGDEMVLTSKGRMYSNVKKENGKLYLYTKREGKRLEIKTVNGTDEHEVFGHERLECYTCHSNTVVQCYGCHTTYDKSEKMMDWIKMEETQGRFSEKEDIRTFFPFPLGVNQRGKISPVTPGCQTFLNVIDENGNKVMDEHIFKFRGEQNFKFAPFYSHNTGKKAVTCAGCHGDMMFAGLGQGIVSIEEKSITSTYMCDKCDKPMDSLYSVEDGKLSVTSDVVREHSRLMTKEEIASMLRVNQCIVCHDKGESRFYGEDIDYGDVLNDSVHRPLLD
ncbi:selenite/tellurite reduction operon c-type cytochrome ExtM [Limisalsivibrio acetivorans]|uniref:selenite/tellurite reduction operon c-type cytochrome ExtM n=1 Tax=Limisalsivibrio acetivorans TaxID=1304888 RepID=UPI0003B65EBF|nr:selenite/tellurite reduction operon c-type cytochrome ExtM [Limisalsivibrio acetivorans]